MDEATRSLTALSEKCLLMLSTKESMSICDWYSVVLLVNASLDRADLCLPISMQYSVSSLAKLYSNLQRHDQEKCYGFTFDYTFNHYKKLCIYSSWFTQKSKPRKPPARSWQLSPRYSHRYPVTGEYRHLLNT